MTAADYNELRARGTARVPVRGEIMATVHVVIDGKPISFSAKATIRKLTSKELRRQDADGFAVKWIASDIRLGKSENN